MRVRGRTDGRECEREQTALRSDGCCERDRAGSGAEAGPGPVTSGLVGRYVCLVVL